ncbi:hypothetical protein ABZ499_31355 [Streptomyces sp. NPDC019990]|uniref:hypothetical protein n=1 Tax=Streptomyces sp. NPDC019990 TaxID=3154693 RepID=UPI0033FF6DC9
MAAALAHLLADHPELGSITWSVGEKPGVLTGHQLDLLGQGQSIDACAEIMGGNVVRASHWRGDSGDGVAELVTTFDGVTVHVWVSYVLTRSTLTAAELRSVLSGRRLGTLVDIAGGDNR